jgi:hypothetical protein
MTTDGPIPLIGFEGIDRIIKMFNDTEDPKMREKLANAEANVAGLQQICEKVRPPKPDELRPPKLKRKLWFFR